MATNLPITTPMSGKNFFMDVFGKPVLVENALVVDNFDIFDKTQIHFAEDGTMHYRGSLYSMSAGFDALDVQLQALYSKNYASRRGDFTTIRSTDRGSSTSSSSEKVILPPRNDGDATLPQIDGSDMSGLSTFPLSIDSQVPLSHSYRQYEPRGFKLRLEPFTTEEMINGISNDSNNAGILSLKRKKVGFNTEEVVLYNGLNCTPCRPSNLADPLQTPLFRQENFYDTPQDVYDVLLPGLKLAEKIMTDRSQIGYWATLAFGTRELNEQMTRATGVCHERLVNRVAVTDDVYKKTLNLLERMGKIVEFRFEFVDYFKMCSCYGFVKATMRQWNLSPEFQTMQNGFWPSGTPLRLGMPYPKDPWDHPQVVHLHPDFYVTAKRFAATKNQDVAARLRFNFWFAINICHELAHVFELRSSQSQFEARTAACKSLEEFNTLVNTRKDVGTCEASWGNSPWTEAGARWEWEVFGGRIQPINSVSDASQGMMVFNADGSCNLLPVSSPFMARGTCIQMGFIEEMQQQSFWSRPVRNLKLPLGVGAKAYLKTYMLTANPQDFLIQQDKDTLFWGDPLTDPKDIELYNLLMSLRDQDINNDAEGRETKRRKIDEPSSKATAAPHVRLTKKAPKRGRLGQPLIRRYINKADADEKAMRAEAAASISRKEEEERAKQDALQHAIAEERRRYRSPSPGQTSLHEFLNYHGEEFHDFETETGFEDDYVDPATKSPEDLTLLDRWTIAEEFICLTMNWEPIEFVAQRRKYPHWRPLPPFNPDEPSTFDQTAIDELLHVRQTRPGRSWPERRRTEKALYEQKRGFAERVSAIDELLTYLGYSRIESFRTCAETGKFPLGITPFNFNREWRPMLDAFRLTQKIHESGEYRSALNRGDIKTGVVTAINHLTADGTTAPVESELPESAKITNYFTQEQQQHPQSHSEQQAEKRSKSSSSDNSLGRVPTRESMREKYEAWINAGSDMRKLPDGFTATQMLSATLGGSLRTVRTKDLAKLVETRTQQLELEKEAERKARAEAAEKRSKALTKGSGSKSKSTSEEL